MHAGEIKASLSKLGVTQRQVAADVGVKETVVSAVVNGKARSQRIEERISEITDIPLYRLWPQWHEPPAGAPKEFDPMKLSFELLEAVERAFTVSLQRRIPDLPTPAFVRGRHRAAVYNACVTRGIAAIETGAGVAEEVEKYLDAWVQRQIDDTTEQPSADVMRKWALYESAVETQAARPSIHASGNSIANYGDIEVKKGGIRLTRDSGKGKK